MNVHREHVEKLLQAKKSLKTLGIGTSIQIQMTISHGGDIRENEGWEAKTWNGWTGSTGVEATHCNCPRQPEFLEYIRQMVRLYAQVKPRVLWIDDDLRYDNHYPATKDSRIGCWCATCIEEFSEQENKKWTRETLNEAMASDKELEERWRIFSLESLNRIAHIIADETLSVSPDTKMGYQKTFWDRDTTVVRTILRTLADISGKKVSYRPGGAAYYDKLHPANQIIKSMDAARYMKILGCGDIVESWCPEIETYPRHYGSRTGQGVLLESFSALAYGMDAVSMFVLDKGEESIDVQSISMLHPLDEGAKVLKKYARANKGTIVVGYSADVTNSVLFDFGMTGIPVLPGLGKNLGKIEDEDFKGVNICSQPSSMIQALRERLNEKVSAPVLCCSPFVGLMIPRIDSNGALRTLGLVNCRIDTQNSIRFSFPALSTGVKSAVWRELRKKPVKLKVKHDIDGTAYVEIPSIAAWNAGFVDF